MRTIRTFMCINLIAVAFSTGCSDSGKKPGVELPEELTVEKLREVAKEQPHLARASVREAMRSEELTEEQKRAVMRNARRVMMERIGERIDEYENAPEDQKEAVLDRHIDEFAKMREQWAKDREARRKEREANGETEEQQRESMRWRFTGGQTRGQRKARSESRNPEASVRRISYFQKMRSRAEARGIEMPGRGGPGGSRGGGDRGGRG